MDDPSDMGSYPDRIRSWARSGALAARPNSSTTDVQQQAVKLGPVTKADRGPLTFRHGVDTDPQAAGGRPDLLASETEAGNPTGSMTNPQDGASSPVAQDETKLSRAQRALRALKMIICYSWINVLLICVPAGIAVHAAHLNHTVIFVVNALAIVPLAALLGYATESVARRMGDTVGALMNVTFGNAVELIILFDSLSTPLKLTLSLTFLPACMFVLHRKVLEKELCIQSPLESTAFVLALEINVLCSD